MLSPILVGSIAQLLIQHGDKLIPSAEKLAQILGQIADKGRIGDVIQIVGHTVQHVVGPGQATIIGMLDQLQTKENQISTAINVLDSKQTQMLAGLAGLKAVSMISLGFAGLAAGVILWQVSKQQKRLNEIAKQIKKVQQMLVASETAKLMAGVANLQLVDNAGDKVTHDQVDSVLSSVMPAGIWFRDFAKEHDYHENDFRVLQSCARNYYIALNSEISSRFAIGDVSGAKLRLSDEEKHLKEIAKYVYDLTLAGAEERLLSDKEVSLDVVSELYQQAQQLGLIAGEVLLSPAAIFEIYRETRSHRLEKMLKNTFGPKEASAGERIKLAKSIFSETQAVLAWRSAIVEMERASKDPRTLRQDLDCLRRSSERSSDDDSFIAYSLN